MFISLNKFTVERVWKKSFQRKREAHPLRVRVHSTWNNVLGIKVITQRTLLSPHLKLYLFLNNNYGPVNILIQYSYKINDSTSCVLRMFSLTWLLQDQCLPILVARSYNKALHMYSSRELFRNQGTIF